MMPLTSRRRFLERLGLGVGATLLAPIADSLIGEALGAASVGTRKRIVFYVNVNGIQPINNFTPKEFMKPNSNGDPYAAHVDEPILNGPKDYTWPRMLKALEPYRNRMMLLDGLANRLPDSQHSCGYGALSGITAASGMNEGGGAPGGITIDQFIANAIGGSTPIKSVLMGINKFGTDQATSIFAAGKNQPLPYMVGENSLYKKLFGSMTGPVNLPGSSPGSVDPTVKPRVLFDSMRDDIKRLQSALAGPERTKLDQYLSAIASMESGLKARQMVSCSSPPRPRAEGQHELNERDPLAIIEDRLESMIDMAAVALGCGLTNVLGNAVACGNEHGTWLKYYRLYKNEAQEMRKTVTSDCWEKFDGDMAVTDQAHQPGSVSAPAMDLIHNFHAACIKRLIEPLMAIKEGDKTVFDNTVVVYTSDNGDDHHATHEQWPFVIVGDAGGALKSDGRFVRYPISSRGTCDLFCTLATAVGAPTTTFGAGGQEPVKGPLPEIMNA